MSHFRPPNNEPSVRPRCDRISRARRGIACAPFFVNVNFQADRKRRFRSRSTFRSLSLSLSLSHTHTHRHTHAHTPAFGVCTTTLNLLVDSHRGAGIPGPSASACCRHRSLASSLHGRPTRFRGAVAHQLMKSSVAARMSLRIRFVSEFRYPSSSLCHCLIFSSSASPRENRPRRAPPKLRNRCCEYFRSTSTRLVQAARLPHGRRAFQK